MNLKPLGTNKTELEFNDVNGVRIRVLFSYQTPVAYSALKEDGQHYYRTSQYYSRTTNKHIKSWLPFEDALEVEQSQIDDVVNTEVK